MPGTCEQPHAVAVTLNDKPVAVVLNFVDPLGPVWNLGAFDGNAGFERSTHAVYLGDVAMLPPSIALEKAAPALGG